MYMIASSKTPSLDTFKKLWAMHMSKTEIPEFGQRHFFCEGQDPCMNHTGFQGWKQGLHDEQLLCEGDASLMYDAAVTLAVVLDRLLTQKNIAIESLTATDWMEELQQLADPTKFFQCLSGEIAFDANQERLMGMDVFNWHSGQLAGVRVGSWRKARGFSWEIGETVVWPSGDQMKITNSYHLPGLPSGLPPVCSPGFVYDVQASGCMPCQKGHFLPSRNDTMYFHCLVCRSGTYSDSTGSTECSVCPPGSYSNDDGASECFLCAVGRHQPHPGSSDCSKCEAGTFANGTGAMNCERCPSGKHQANEGYADCDACAETFVTNHRGATSSSECVCSKGTYFEQNRGSCVMCDPLLLECPGGHSQIDFGDSDTSVRVREGFMTLQEDPFSVYTCVDGSLRCPGSRSWCDIDRSMCANGFDASVMRCGRCLADHYLSSDGTCRPCEANTPLNAFKLVAAYIAQFVVVFYMYYRYNRPNPSGMISAGALLAFFQTLQSLSLLPLRWPTSTKVIFKAINVLSVEGLTVLLEYDLDCLTTDAAIFEVVLNAISPLVIFADFALLHCVFWLFRQRLQLDFVMNIIGMWYTKLFISISRMTMELFFTERMPNGKLMVKAVPDLEFDSPKWREVVPLSVAACALYCGTTLVVTACAVYQAPFWAATCPHFTARYRFAFGALRPDRWWWVLVQVFFGFLTNLVLAISSNAHASLYLSVFVLVIFTGLEYIVLPFKYPENNFADLCLKSALVIFLILSTSFIDHSVLSKEYEDEQNKFFGHLLFAIILLAVACIALSILYWSLTLLCPERSETASNARILWRFRDVMLAQLMMPEHEALQKMSQLSQYDILKLESATQTVVNILFGQQFSPAWRHRRLIRGATSQMWNYPSMFANLMQQIESGDCSAKIKANGEVRKCLVLFAAALREHGSDRQSTSSMASRAKSMIRSSEIKFTSAAQMDRDTKFSPDEFRDFCSRVTEGRLADEEADLIFQAFDFAGKGSVSQQDIVLALAGLAPREVSTSHSVLRLGNASLRPERTTFGFQL
eukprot:TRINITY_DN8259_c0_g2_i2.p1 TRINITY_DN8259_c0_g2~~TRINITY_DN8259_c0_g2_i2.p1  ORF type:complete len:1211 (+),score=137.59 TRINITY_DN8259_c0_g2_i2:532-3633(+)